MERHRNCHRLKEKKNHEWDWTFRGANAFGELYEEICRRCGTVKRRCNGLPWVSCTCGYHGKKEVQETKDELKRLAGIQEEER